MIPDNFKTLVDKLKEKTTRKETIWSNTGRDDIFKLDLVKGAITVNRWKNETGQQFVDVSIINERGDKIDNICFHDGEIDDYKYLAELHSLAKRAYYKVDETFKTILEELDSDKIIGIDRVSDLPF